jgi:hypothetical protein
MICYPCRDAADAMLAGNFQAAHELHGQCLDCMCQHRVEGTWINREMVHIDDTDNGRTGEAESEA